MSILKIGIAIWQLPLGFHLFLDTTLFQENSKFWRAALTKRRSVLSCMCALRYREYYIRSGSSNYAFLRASNTSNADTSFSRLHDYRTLPLVEGLNWLPAECYSQTETPKSRCFVTASNWDQFDIFLTRYEIRNIILKLDLRSSGMLRSVYWYLVTDVAGRPIDHIFKRQSSKRRSVIFEDGNDTLSWNVG